MGFNKKFLCGVVYWAFSYFSSGNASFQILGVSPPKIHFNILDLGGLLPRFGSVVSEQVMIPWEQGFDPYFSFKIFSNIQRNSGMCYNLHKVLSWVKQEEFFFFQFFWAVALQIRYETFSTKFTKTNTISGLLSKNHLI